MDLSYVRYAAGAFFLCRFAVRGYRRRRPVWSASAWRRFAALAAVPVGAAGVGLAMAVSVDHGVYAALGRGAAGRVYFYALMSLMALGAFGAPLVLVWFAQARPESEVRWPSRARPRRAAG